MVKAPVFSWEELETFSGVGILPEGGLAVGVFQAKTIKFILKIPTNIHPANAQKKYIL
jgi:hypothetical protein